MIEVKDKNITIYFAHQKDANNYIDYLKNGLKVIRASNREYRFNNGDIMYDVSMKNDKIKRYVLHSGNRRITSEKLQKKHIEAISK